MSSKKGNKIVIFPMYHYLKRKDEFKRIWGHDFDLFKQHIQYYQKNYPPISSKDLVRYLSGEDVDLPAKSSVLTFDDSLKEQADVIAPYLAEKGISGHFNLSGCILRQEPLNPQVIHFGTAYYGIRKFVAIVKHHFSVTSLNWQDFKVLSQPQPNIDQLLSDVKKLIKYELDNSQERRLLLEIWKRQMLKDFPDLFDRVHLNKSDVKQLIVGGHEIGVHSDSHPLINDNTFTKEMLTQEFEKPKQELEKVTDKEIKFFAFPYGTAADVIDNKEYLGQIKNVGFDYLFTGQSSSGESRQFDQTAIIRYPSYSNHTLDILKKEVIMYEIII